MSKNGGTIGFVIKWGAISAVIVGVLAYFGVVNVNDQRIKNKLDQAERYISGLFGEAEDTVGDVVGDAKDGLNDVKNDVKGAARGAVNNAEDVVDDAAAAAKDTAKDATRGAAGTVNEVKQELQ